MKKIEATVALWTDGDEHLTGLVFTSIYICPTEERYCYALDRGVCSYFGEVETSDGRVVVVCRYPDTDY